MRKLHLIQSMKKDPTLHLVMRCGKRVKRLGGLDFTNCEEIISAFHTKMICEKCLMSLRKRERNEENK